MKLLVGSLLLSAQVSPATAFLQKCAMDTAHTQLRGHGMIDSDYLQSELATFANEQLARGLLLQPSSFFETPTTTLSFHERMGISSLPSFLPGANDALSQVAADTGNPLATFQESAMSVLSSTPLASIKESVMSALSTTSLASIQESAMGALSASPLANVQEFAISTLGSTPLFDIQESAMSAWIAASGQWDIFSSILASNWMANTDFASDVMMVASSSSSLSSLVASMFMMTAMAVSISDSIKPSTEDIMNSPNERPAKENNDFLFVSSLFTNDDSDFLENVAASLEPSITLPKIEYRAEKATTLALSKVAYHTEKMVANSAADAASADTDLLVTTFDVTAEEISKVEAVNVDTVNTEPKLSPFPVLVREKKEEGKIVMSALFAEARSITLSIKMKIARLSFQVQQFFRIVIQTFQKVAIIRTRGSSILPKYVMPGSTKFSLVPTLWVSFKNRFFVLRRQQL